MNCPKCGDENAKVQAVSDSLGKFRNVLMWVVWLLVAAICLFFGRWVLMALCIAVPIFTSLKWPLEARSIAVCQKCGASWDVVEQKNIAQHMALNTGVAVLIVAAIVTLLLLPSRFVQFTSNQNQSPKTETTDNSIDPVQDTLPSSMYSVDVVGHEVLFDYADRRVIAVNLEYTNNTNETVEPSDHIEVIAFQNGVELSGAFVVLDFEPDVSGLDLYKEVKPGATLSLWVGYELDDKSTVSVEIRGTRRAGSDVQVFDINPFARSAPVEVQGLDIQYVSHEFYAYENYTIMNLTLSFKNQSINDIRPDDYLYPVAFQDQIELAMFICSDRDITLHPEDVIELQYHYVIQDREIPVSFSLCLFDSELEYYSEEIPVVS